MDKKSDIIEKRKKKLLDLKKNNINLYPNDFVVLHTVSDIKKAVKDSPDSLTEDEPVFVVAGRMMAINRFGKASFIRFRDRTGQLQAYVRKDK
ncbi:MAG: lysine--tRNA ligase, partial [Desulfobacterales bacterium]